jgi:drug/metabolite transporter (DMT)-like permease
MWIAYALTAMVLWGLNYTLDEKILDSKISIVTLVGIQCLFAAIGLLGISLATTWRSDIQTLFSTPKLLWLFGISVLVFTVASWFIAASIQVKNATIAGMIEAAYPFATIFFTWLLFNVSHINWATVIGGILIITGVVLIYAFSPA